MPITKKSKHIIIDAKNQEIKLVEGVELTLQYMQSIVGGLIERVPRFTGYGRPDDLWVNEEGRIIAMNSDDKYGFCINGITCYGNGLITGEYVEHDDKYGYKDVVTDVEVLKKRIGWRI